MQRQTAVRESPFQRSAQGRSLRLTRAVTDRIVRIALEPNAGMVPRHPCVEGVVQKQVRQHGAYHPTLRSPSLPDDEATIRHLCRCLQPSLDVHQHPRAPRVLAHRPHQQRPVDAVEEGLDIKIQDPPLTPASLPCHADRIERRLAGSIPIGILVEHRFHKRLQVSFDHHLGDAISNRWYPQRPRPAIALRYVHPPHRCRKVAPGRHSIPEPVEVVREINLEVRDRLPIHSGRTLVGFHPLVGFPYFSLRNVKRLCSIHRAPPIAG